MPQLVNPTYEALSLPGVGRIEGAGTVDADGNAVPNTLEVSDAVAEAYVGHPVIEVEGYTPPAEQPAAAAPEQVTVSVPAGDHIEVVPDAPAASTEAVTQ